MSVNIGLSITRAAVHAVILNGGAERWRSSVTLGEQDTMQVAIERLLASAPAELLRRAVVAAALSPQLAPIRRLEGLPVITDPGVLLQLVRANPRRYFVLAQGTAFEPVVHRSGDAWTASLLDRLTIDAVQATCDTAGLRFLGAAPVAAGANDDVFEAARAAAAFSRTSPLFLAARGGAGIRAARIRRVTLVAACVVAALAAVTAPILRTEWRIRSDRRALGLLNESVQQAAPSTQRLRQANAGLEQIARFAKSRRSMTEVLGAIASALPESTAVVSLRVDTLSGSMTLLSTAAASAISRLSASPAIADAKVGGPVTREEVGGARLQRLTVRFRIAQDSLRPAGNR